MMKLKDTATQDQFHRNNSGTRFVEGSNKLAFTWERLIPKLIADDAASKKILDLHLQRYETAARYIKGKKVLDIACGVGYGSQMLGLAGASSVVGVDVCPHTVEYAREHYQSENVNFVCADALEFQWPEQFDVVVSFETIEHLHQPAHFVKLIHNLLAPEGNFILSVPLGETRHLDRYHLHAFSQEDIFGLLDNAGFSVSQYHCEDYCLTRSDLLTWRRLYPAARLSFLEQYFTRRGWQLIGDFIFRGGVPFPQLLVVANRLNNINIA